MKFNSEIAIGLNTFLRDDSLKRFIASCRTYYPELKIYIVDQCQKFTAEKKKFYDYLRYEGHMIQKIPYDCGISEARERLRKFVKEPYLMYMQDDFIICPETNIYTMHQILKDNPKLGVVCGAVITRRTKPYTASCPNDTHAYFLQKIDDKIVYMPVQYLLDMGLIEYQRPKRAPYVICDMSWDFSLWKKDAQIDLFDTNVHVLEHTHVYLTLKKLKRYKVAYTSKSVIVHTHDRSNSEYSKLRVRKDDVIYLNNYWHVKDFIVLSGKEVLPDIPKLLTTTSQELINPSLTNTILSNFVILMQNLNKTVILAKDTCLQAIVNHRLNTIDLFVFVSTFTPDELQYLAGQHYIYSPDTKAFIKDNHQIFVSHILPEKTKLVHIEGKYYHVPFPAHKYLEKTFGKNWQELGRKYAT